MLIEQRITEDGIKTIDKVEVAIARLREFEPKEGYYLAFSGGKDSIVIYDLAQRSGVKFEAYYNVTTVDPPELMKFIRQYYPHIKKTKPRYSMFKLIAEIKLFPPLRQQRWCCEWLKEGGGAGRMVVTGVRNAESTKRAGRRMVENCKRGNDKMFINPIIDWTDDDVWSFIRGVGLAYCSLYDEGFKRIGCVMCPMANQKEEAERWPKIAEKYRKACIEAHENATKAGKKRSFADGNELYEWWITGKKMVEPDQRVLFE